MADIKRIGVAARYSDLVIHGNTAYFSGYVPETSLGQSVTAQTRDVLAQIEQDPTLQCPEVQYVLDFIRTSKRGVGLRRPSRRLEELVEE